MLVHSELPEKPEKLRLWTIIQQVGWRTACTSGRVRLNDIRQAKSIVWSWSWWSSLDLFRISWGSRTTARVLVCWDFSVPGEECTRFLSKVKKKKDQSIWIQGKITKIYCWFIENYILGEEDVLKSRIYLLSLLDLMIAKIMQYLCEVIFLHMYPL